LNGDAANPRLPVSRTANGNLSERGVVPVALQHLSELMIVTLPCDRRNAP
jgi:hypothetical protein